MRNGSAIVDLKPKSELNKK